eukprot:CAMPEP_0114002138 /NCGR_PEP_ID=MMETSP0372-20130328/1280_1 /TAXON_ID=340204 /ORGANISM="Lankesteria abbotti" /LENGTH=41 /assembly_acc=CAM_ASM_000359
MALQRMAAPTPQSINVDPKRPDLANSRRNTKKSTAIIAMQV